MYIPIHSLVGWLVDFLDTPIIYDETLSVMVGTLVGFFFMRHSLLWCCLPISVCSEFKAFVIEMLLGNLVTNFLKEKYRCSLHFS
jgi:hypothetical protein